MKRGLVLFCAFAWSACADAGTESQWTTTWKSRRVNVPALSDVSTTTVPGFWVNAPPNETLACPSGGLPQELIEARLAPTVAW